ncbi:MAG: hypothetical protein IJJ20_06270 [Thermoguttaceae bacterium]|nr:hypothetical protein [Thermoguttaceae bacterium]
MSFLRTGNFEGDGDGNFGDRSELALINVTVAGNSTEETGGIDSCYGFELNKSIVALNTTNGGSGDIGGISADRIFGTNNIVGGCFLFVLCYLLLFALLLVSTPAFWTLSGGRWCYFGGLLVVLTVLVVLSLAMSSVYYLTATGQKRSGTGRGPKLASDIS